MKSETPTREEIIDLLTEYRTPFRFWNGQLGESLDGFVSSIRLGETWLEAASDGLIHHVNVAVVTVRHLLNGQWLELREDRQEFPDGTIKRRKFSGSLGEKIRENETPLNAAKRGLFEELSFPKHAKYQMVSDEIEVTQRRITHWYPGLTDKYNRNQFMCDIPQEMYKPEYVEIYLNKRIYFKWIPTTLLPA